MRFVYPLAVVVCIVLAVPFEARCEEKPPESPHIEIGKVKLFRSEGRVEVPGVVTVDRNLIELFACSEGGKAHESVLVLDCRPSNLNLALKLLGLDDGGQVKVRKKVPVEKDGKIVEVEKDVMEENGPNYVGDPRRPEGDRVIVTVRWKEDGKPKEVRAEDMIYERARGRTMPRAGWIFVGSLFVKNPNNGKEEFAADHSKCILTTWHDHTTLLDNPLPDGGDDEVYFANSDIVPARGTKVVMEIRRPTKEEEKEADRVEAEERKKANEKKGEGEEKR
ncbi:MAG: YdjY domain-containing protein [Planctomycetota bacterium]|jgi:hypothetical protein